MIPFISNLFQLPVTRKDVLKRAKKIKKCGLCTSISYALNEYDILYNDYYLSILFPKFARENALRFGAHSYKLWWWTPNEWETGRMDFLNWLIEEYKDDKTNLRKL